MHGLHVLVCTPYHIWKCSWQTIPLGSPPRPELAHHSAPGQSVVLCSGGSTIHNVPEMLGCLHPGPSATFQPHEAERCHAPGKTQGPVQQADRISFWYLPLAEGLCGPPRIVCRALTVILLSTHRGANRSCCWGVALLHPLYLSWCLLHYLDTTVTNMIALPFLGILAYLFWPYLLTPMSSIPCSTTRGHCSVLLTASHLLLTLDPNVDLCCASPATHNPLYSCHLLVIATEAEHKLSFSLFTSNLFCQVLFSFPLIACLISCFPPC